MKKFGIFLLICSVVVAFSCCYPGRSSNEVTQRSTAVGGFDKIVNASTYDVYYEQGDTFKVTVRAGRHDLKYLQIRVKDSTLYIDERNSRFFHLGSDVEDVAIFVVSPDIVRMSQKGTGSIVCEKPIDTDCLDLSLSGTGDIRLGQVTCDDLRARLIGTGDIDVDSLTAPRASVSLAGTGDIDVHFVRSGVVKASLTGTGDISLSGDVQRLTTTQVGTGDIDVDKLHTAEK